MNPQTTYLRRRLPSSSSSGYGDSSSYSSSSSSEQGLLSPASSLLGRLLSNIMPSQNNEQPENDYRDDGYVGGHINSNSSSSSYEALTAAPSSSSNTTATTVVDDYSASSNSDIHQNPLALTLPRISALLSLMAVLCVATEAWYDYRADQRQRALSSTSGILPQSRSRKVPTVTYVQLFFQIPLFVQAVALAMGTNPVPASAYYADVWGASGTTTTCDIQGLMVQFSMIGCVGWDMALSSAYLSMVRYNVRSTRLQRYHKYYHIIIWPIALAMCIYPLTQGMYNYNTTVCWLESFPNECQGDECERGQNSQLWQNITSLIAVVHFLFSIMVVLTLYCTVRRLTNNSNATGTASRQPQDHHSKSTTKEGRRRSSSSPSSPSNNYSRAIGIQGMLYASGVFVTVFPTVLLIMLWNATGIWSDGFSIFATTTTPLMGYVNFVIFMRGRKVDDCHTRYAKFLRRIHSCLFDRSWIRALCGCWSHICCCTCHCNIEWTGPLAPHRGRDDNHHDNNGVDQRRRGQQDPSNMEDLTASTTHHRLNHSLSDFTGREFNSNTTRNTNTTSGTSTLFKMDENEIPKEDVLPPRGLDEEPQQIVGGGGKRRRKTRNNGNGTRNNNNEQTTSSWLGFLISWKNSSRGEGKDNQPSGGGGGGATSSTVGSQMIVSALGCESVGTPHPDDSKHFDFSPSKPTRQRSPKSQDRLPPTQPRRAISEVEEDVDKDDFSSKDSDSSSDHSFNFPDVKPRIPRLGWGTGNYMESFLETFTGPTTKKTTTGRPKSQTPVKPTRLESLVSEMTLEEIEDWHYSSRSSKSLLVPPSLPQRLVSEVEEMTTSDEESRCSASSYGATVNLVRPNNDADDDEVNQADPEKQSLSSAMKAAMLVVERTILEDTAPRIAARGRGADEGLAPAIQPQRFLSQAESFGSTSSSNVDEDALRGGLRDYFGSPSTNSANNDHAKMTMSGSSDCPPEARGVRGSDEVPPTRPVRLVSEVEGLSDTECESDSLEAPPPPPPPPPAGKEGQAASASSTSSGVEKEVVPAQTSRFASEVEVAEWMIEGISSDTDTGSSPQTSFASSEKLKIGPLTNSRGSDQVPPVPPVRFTSEAESPSDT